MSTVLSKLFLSLLWAIFFKLRWLKLFSIFLRRFELSGVNCTYTRTYIHTSIRTNTLHTQYMLYTWRLWTRFKVNTFFFSLCIENHISRQDRWDERRNFFHWQRKRFSYPGINHTFQPSKSQSLKQFWKINHVLLGFVFLSVVNLKKKYVKNTVNSRNNFSHRLPHNSSNNNIKLKGK